MVAGPWVAVLDVASLDVASGAASPPVTGLEGCDAATVPPFLGFSWSVAGAPSSVAGAAVRDAAATPPGFGASTAAGVVVVVTVDGRVAWGVGGVGAVPTDSVVEGVTAESGSVVGAGCASW